MSANAMSLKAKIRNLAKQKSIPAQVVLQNYMFERLLVRLAASNYKDNFVLKGGMLISAIVGLDNRVTMDLDTSLKNLPLTLDSIRTTIQEISRMEMEDGVIFIIGNISPIRDDDVYGGYRVAISAEFETIHTPLTVDVTTGDVMTPDATRFTYTTQRFDKVLFTEALSATANHRGNADQLGDIPKSLQIIAASKDLQNMWGGYRKQFAYAQNIDFDMIIAVLSDLLS